MLTLFMAVGFYLLLYFVYTLRDERKWYKIIHDETYQLTPAQGYSLVIGLFLVITTSIFMSLMFLFGVPEEQTGAAKCTMTVNSILMNADTEGVNVVGENEFGQLTKTIQPRYQSFIRPGDKIMIFEDGSVKMKERK